MPEIVYVCGKSEFHEKMSLKSVKVTKTFRTAIFYEEKYCSQIFRCEEVEEGDGEKEVKEINPL